MPESSPPADTLLFDTEWFTQRVMPEAAVAYEQQFREKYGPRPKPLARSAGGAIWMYSALAVWAVLGVLILVWTTVWMPADQRQLDEPLERIMFGLVLLLPYSIAYGLLASWLTWVFFGHHDPERYARFRLHSFAERNGLDYEPFVALNDRDQVTDIVRFTRGRAIEIGNLQTVVPGTQSGATVFLYSYVAVGLAAVLPHIVLDARANQLQLAIGSGVDDDQRLSLEGDFGRHFTLYCPTGVRARCPLPLRSGRDGRLHRRCTDPGRRDPRERPRPLLRGDAQRAGPARVAAHRIGTERAAAETRGLGALARRSPRREHGPGGGAGGDAAHWPHPRRSRRGTAASASVEVRPLGDPDGADLRRRHRGARDDPELSLSGAVGSARRWRASRRGRHRARGWPR
ncbi:hypothetical protein [Microbacterium nymphoidis]|uniref:hypothetical protein n=1 Tax=Microbacterium nymphoidis TaxID=2898586 RepID=UPI001E5BB14E|nr:hypothetical protein [Microbacterium nymphoidis]MCD2497836.1 hypothetical protein [Microbacterium nymphoidis]